MYNRVLNELKNIKDEETRKVLQRFFKTGKGQYGEGDLFLGIKVPDQKKIAKKYYKNISLNDTEKLLHNKYHECRLTALFILRFKYEKEDKVIQEQTYNLYMKNTKYINNWDLVDSSAPYISGPFIFNNNIDKKVLYDFINSNDLWKQRIAVMSTFYFVKQDDYTDTIKMSELLLNHKHDLIHKAVGWMLREIGNRNYNVLFNFLNKYYKQMPRTMLRYAIEKINPKDKKHFMS